MGSGAAQQVHFVRTGGGNEQIRIQDAGLLQNIHGGTVSVDGNYVVTLHAGLQDPGIGVDNRNIVAFGNQLPGQGGANLTVARNDNIHKKPPEKRKIPV